MPRGSFTAARHVSYSDTWLAAGVGSRDFKELRDDQDFRPQAVICNSSSDETQQLGGYAFVRGFLFGENVEFVDTYRIPIGQPVGLAFRVVYANGTTARGLKLLSEI